MKVISHSEPNGNETIGSQQEGEEMVTISRIASYLGSSPFSAGEEPRYRIVGNFEGENFHEFRIFHQSAKVFCYKA